MSTMKKLLGIVSITVLIFSNSANAGKWGEGELQLTRSVVDYFIQFVRGKGNKSPADFYVTLDGTDGMYWYCSQGICREGSAATDIKKCEIRTKKKCKKFAFQRTIKWKNGINPAKGKASTINSKWSDAEIYAKLTELGFYKNDFSKNSTKKDEKKDTKKVTKKTTTISSDNSSDIVTQLQELIKLFDDGKLTQEEFNKAKKKLLN